jgi:hypothetical protein
VRRNEDRVRVTKLFWLSTVGVALVFEVAPKTIFGFGKAPYSQTRWRFG